MSMKIVWQVPVLEKSFLKSLQTKRFLIAYLHLFTRLSLQILLGVALYYAILNLEILLAAFLALIFGMTLSFMSWAGAGHEYFHSTAFRSARANRLLFRIMSCATWNNWGWFETSHWLHHKFTLHEKDPEGPPQTSLSRRNLLWLILLDLPTFLRRIRILVQNSFGYFLIKDIQIRDIVLSRNSVKQRIRIGAISVLLFQAAVFVLLSQFSISLALIVAVSPFLFSLPNRILEICQHLGLELHSDDFRKNTRTVRMSYFLEFLYSNMNYHMEHHMFPGIPYYNLPQLHQKLRQDEFVPQADTGLLSATKIAFSSSRFSEVKGRQCLNCTVSCPIKPVEFK